MHIMILGKVPPIQGGVSRSTWRAAVDLAKAGHTVDVVSNAAAMAPGFRQMMRDSDRAIMDSHPGLTCHMTDQVAQFAYIPWAPPHLSQLLGLAAQVCADRLPDAVIGWYFEPYGVAAGIIGERIGRPVLLRHAGSDIGRLATYGDLATAYRHMLSTAACVVTTPRSGLAERLVAAGAAADRVRAARGRALDPEFSDGSRLDLREVAAEAEAVFSTYRLPDDLLQTLREWNRLGLENGDPTLGTYGKIAEVKGTYQLIDALDMLARDGVPFRYCALWSAQPSRFAHTFGYLAARPALKGRTVVLPPLPPWRVPGFVRQCDAVAFLENRFPIDIHGPQIPREVLACGRPLIVSGEIFDKLVFRDQLVPGRNVERVDDPDDRATLAAVIRHVLQDAAHRRTLEHHGATLSRAMEATAPAADFVVQAVEDMVAA